MENATVFAMGSRFDLGVEIFTPRSGVGVISRNTSRNHLYTCEVLDMSPLICYRSLCPNVDLDLRAF